MRETLFAELEQQFARGAKEGSFASAKRRAWELFLEKGLPTKEEEAFRYLPLSELYGDPLGEVRALIQGEESTDSRVQILPLAKAQVTYAAFLQSRCQAFLREEKDPFALLSFAVAEEGIFLYVPPGVEVKESISLSFGGEGTFSPALLYCFLGRGAKLSLSVELKGDFSLVYSDITLDEGASLSLVTKREGKRHADTLRATLKKDAFFTSTALSKGGDCLRESTIARLLGEGSRAEVKGLDLVGGDSNAHHWIRMEHIAPHTSSHQHFKAVLRERGKMSAEGKIYVEAAAQKTDAYQLINALVLDEGAICYAKPNLEVFADDVKASHGATIGQLSDSERFYLQTRGLPKKEAEELLLVGFCEEILAPIGGWKGYARD